jgi:hypothetical protein
MRTLRTYGARTAIVGALAGIVAMVGSAGSASAAEVNLELGATVDAAVQLLVALGIYV